MERKVVLELFVGRLADYADACKFHLRQKLAAATANEPLPEIYRDGTPEPAAGAIHGLRGLNLVLVSGRRGGSLF